MLQYYNIQMNSSASTATGKTKIKMVFLGNQSVGKSSIIDQYVNGKFDDTSSPTVGIDFLAKNIVYKNKNYRLQLWDTAGQERFKSLIPSYLRDAHCSLIIFDVSNKSSLNNAENWLHLYNQNKTGDGFTLLVGNKIDLKDQRDVSEEEGRHKAKQLGVIYYEISAKSGENLEQLFSNIVEICTEKSLEGANFSLKPKGKDQSLIIEEEENEGRADGKPDTKREQIKKEDDRIKLTKDGKKVAQQAKQCC